MYAAGNMPDHVTRYSHKRNRWMQGTPVRQPIQWDEIISCIAIAIAMSVVIVLGVMMMQ